MERYISKPIEVVIQIFHSFGKKRWELCVIGYDFLENLMMNLKINWRKIFKHGKIAYEEMTDTFK